MRALIFMAVALTTGIFVVHLVGDIGHARQLQWLLTANPVGDSAEMIRDSLRTTMWRAGIHSAAILLQGLVAFGILRRLGSNRTEESKDLRSTMWQPDAAFTGVTEELRKVGSAGEAPLCQACGKVLERDRNRCIYCGAVGGEILVRQ